MLFLPVWTRLRGIPGDCWVRLQRQLLSLNALFVLAERASTHRGVAVTFCFFLPGC
jgi:hypothetical protein